MINFINKNIKLKENNKSFNFQKKLKEKNERKNS